MTLRTFLFTTTSASLLMTSVPIGICALVATQQRSSRIWDVFASLPWVWFPVSMLLAVAAIVFCGVGFYRRDFGVSIFALLGGVSVFFSLYVLAGSISIP
jgi:hypothetical protein